MRMTLRLAWRNLFRNKRRTFIAGTAIGIGLAALIFTDALMAGMKRNMIRSATATFMGDAQIHRAGWRTTQEAGETIADAAAVQARLREEPAVQAFAPRAMAFGMVTSPVNVASVMLVGVDPDAEPALSRVDEAIMEGTFFGGGAERPLVVGTELAELLEVGLGDRIVVTVAQAESGELSQELFRVSGLYRTGAQEMDRGFAFARLEKVQDMLGIGGIHEIAIRFRDVQFALREDNPFFARYSEGLNEAAPWTEVLPALRAILDLFWISLAVTALILFGIVAFGILNTIFMSLYERLFEFGVLRAVGTRASGVRRLIVAEAGALALVSIALGAILGLALTLIVTETGIDYRGVEIAGTTMAEVLYPVLQPAQFVIYPAGVFVFTLLVSLYPAVVAGRMSIADALRRSL